MIYVLQKLRSINNGGIEAIVFGSTLKINDTNIEIAYCSDSVPHCPKWENAVQLAGRRMYSLDKGLSGLRKRFCYISDFYRLCKKEHFDIVHIHMYGAYDAVYAVAARLAGVKRVIRHSHFGLGADYSILKKVCNSFFRTFSFMGNDICAACSESAKHYMFSKKNAEKCILLHNGIETERFAYDEAVRQRVRCERDFDGAFVIGNVGRLDYQKNHSFLLDIFSELLKQKKNSLLVIAGSGVLEDELKSKAAALGIAEKVVFCGNVENTAELYQAMDCFVFPSHFEGLAIAAIEAQTAGLKTICSDRVSPEEAITDLCSFMPLTASPKEWAEHIISQCNGYERRSYADEVRAAGYDIKDTAKQLEKIYLSLAEE